MQQALLVRLRPSGPWRYGPSDGALDRVDTLYRSDRLYSAITLAMRQLGFLDAWLDATARSEKPAVAFTSLFPFQGDTLFVTPPANLWPPPSSMVTSPSPVFLTKVRWRAAHFVPLSLVDSLLTGQSVLADQWIPDPESGCLLRRDRPSSSPFRTVARATAPVDRLRLTSTDAEPNACVEFEPGAGLWIAIRFVDDAAHDAWFEPLKSVVRLLADTGFGGGRSKGWGQVQTPEFETGAWPALILPKVARVAKNDSHEEQTARSYWLMSLYSPSTSDSVNWSGGQYELTVRNGRVDGSSGALKKSVRMVTEGCILETTTEPIGAAVDVAPAGFAHPVYRSGIALSLLIPPIEARKAIEEIVPPELEATPFPFPATEVIAAPEISVPETTPEPGTAAPATDEALSAESVGVPVATPEPPVTDHAEQEASSGGSARQPAADAPEPHSPSEPLHAEDPSSGGAGLQPAAEPPVPLSIHHEEQEPNAPPDVASEHPVTEPEHSPVHEPEPAPVPVTEPEPQSTPSPEPEPDAPPMTEPEHDSPKEPGYEL